MIKHSLKEKNEKKVLFTLLVLIWPDYFKLFCFFCIFHLCCLLFSTSTISCLRTLVSKMTDYVLLTVSVYCLAVVQAEAWTEDRNDDKSCTFVVV